jgi:anti-anti-sigma regulatory factor
VLTAKERLEQTGAEFGLYKLQPQIKTAFEIVKALPKKNVFASAEEMDRYLAQIQLNSNAKI